MRLVQFFPHDLFEQDLHRAHGQATQVLTKLLLARRTTGDDDCEVEPSGDSVVGLFLATGIAFSCARNTWKPSMPGVSSLLHLFATPRLYTQLGMASFSRQALLRRALSR